jgi:hypothetical protein
MYTFQFNQYKIKYPTNVIAETFDEKWYYGIIFKVGRFKYELIHNYAMNTQRLLITEQAKTGANGWQDIPFKSETFKLLPRDIIVEVR